MSVAAKIRPLDLRQDQDEIAQLMGVCFTAELASRGGDYREQLDSARRLEPLMAVLGRFSDTFQHLFDGFVCEDQGRIVAMVVVQQAGNDKTRWTISSVGTHPDYRRRGLARQLMTHAMEHAKTHGAEVCTLYVLAENQAAYDLYRNLGFIHYDSTTELKLEGTPRVQAKPAAGYRFRAMKIGEWQARYELAIQETPSEVQALLPVTEAQYRVSRLVQLVIPLLMRLQRLKSHPWAVEHEGQVVGYMHLYASRTAKIPHDLKLAVVPAHRAELAEPMLTLALETLHEHPEGITLITVRTALTDLVSLLEQYGFVPIETQHWLGAKLG